MNLTKLSFFSIAGCLFGLTALLVVTIISAGQIRDQQAALAELIELRGRINNLSVASDSLVLFGADADLWRAYRAEADAIAASLKEMSSGAASGDRAAHRVSMMVEFVGTAIGYGDAHSSGPDSRQKGPQPAIPTRERIVQQRIAGQGVALDSAVDVLLRERQQAITSEATRIVIVLATGTLLFGALCVIAFGLIHRRIARPANQIATTLEHIRSGRPEARAAVDGNDELSELAETLNRTLDERDAAEAEARRKGRLLDMAGRAARFGAWSVDLATQQCEWSDMVAEIHCMPHGYSPSVQDSLKFYAPEYQDRIAEIFTACAEHGEPFDEELQIIDANGERRWVRAVGDAARDERGEIVGVQGAFQDISAQKDLALESERVSKRLATMLESITDGFIAFDEQWRYTYVNAEAERLLGKSADELIGGTVWSQFPELAGTKTETALRSAMTQRISAFAEEFFEPLDGWFEMRAYPWEGGVAAIFRNVTETHRMLEQLRAQEAALRASSEELTAALNTRQALVNSLPAHIAMLDAEGVVVDVNDQWRHYGEENAYKGSDFGIGKNYATLCETATGSAAEEAGDVARGLRDVLSGRKDSFALEYPCHSPSEERWFRVMFNRLATDEDKAFGAVAMHIDITQRKQAEHRIRRLAYEDPLTGALSRNGFVQKLNEQLEADGWPANGCLAMIDVVNQHDINDAHGYDRGDQLLKALSERLQTLVDGRGLAGRTGGDEFAVYIAFAASEDIETVLQQLEQTVDEPFVLDEGKISIDIELRIGYTAFGGAQRTTQDLIREAELALFEQRRDTAAGHRRAYTQELKEETQQRIQLTQELQRAVANEEFELHFQPKVDLADGRMISAEALIRWHHPERGLLPPGVFIPVAEQSQLIGPIGDWALRAACRQLSAWRENGLDAVRVAVNVSQVQFVLGDFPAKVRAALEAFDVDPQHLSLEITESVFERQSDKLLSDFRALHDIGVRLALDDFGTGYASLLYVQRYPFDEIKIDRGFVDRVLEDDYSRDIVLAVISVARSLGAEVVAEGIESAAIAAALRDMGCKVGQGYYYSVPLEAGDFRRLLEDGSVLPLARDRDER